MKKYQIRIWSPEEYPYPLAFGFIPSLTFYLHEEAERRPMMLVVPGGGYGFVSPAEGEIVARAFYEKGWQAAVLTYTTDLLHLSPVLDQARKDLCRAMRILRSSAGRIGTDPDAIALCGFSAGGHLCADVCINGEDVPDRDRLYDAVSPRPDAAVLCYPVITSGKYAHQGSFIALLGRDASKEALEAVSLEKHVHPDVPPCFLWATEDDGSVPVQNTYLFAEALEKAGVPHEMHTFPHGRHGLSLANETWAEERYGEPYTLEQTMRLIEAVDRGQVQVPEAFEEVFEEMGVRAKGGNTGKDRVPQPDVAQWPDMADRWLRTVLTFSE